MYIGWASRRSVGQSKERLGQPKEMQRLCTPDRKVYKIEHEDEAQLRSIKQRYNLTANVVHNLRQLLGWRAVGTPKGGANDRVKRLERGGGQLPDPLQCRQARLGCYRPVAQARRRYSRQAARRWTAGPTPAQRMSFCVCVCACRWCKHVKTLSTRSTHSDKGTSDSSSMAFESATSAGNGQLEQLEPLAYYSGK